MKRFITLLHLSILFAAYAAASGENPLFEIKETPGFCSILHSWGFIGDSLSSGEHEHHDGNGKIGWADLYEYSWGKRMCAAMSVEGDVYAQGGETAEGWIKNFWDAPANKNGNIDAKAAPKQAYVIALGVNDRTRGYEPGNVATDVDTLDYRNNAATFAGFYAGIIQRVKSISPDAKIFVVTIPRHSYTDEGFNEVIRSMADTFGNTYVIDLYRHAPEYDKEFTDRYFMGGHMTAVGYQWTAWMMMSYIDYIIRQNIHDFDQAAFINTGYRY